MVYLPAKELLYKDFFRGVNHTSLHISQSSFTLHYFLLNSVFLNYPKKMYDKESLCP